MLKIATVFSGIGAAEQALKQMQIDFEIVFACDNGERYVNIDVDKENKKMENLSNIDRKVLIEKLYKQSGKENNVKKSYFANYNIDENRWFEDIRFLNGREFQNKIDLIVGGSPCQSFSTYGKRLGLEDTRGTLFYDYARIIKEVSPKAFIFENVTGLLNHDKGKTWETIKNVFEELHYKIEYNVLDAQDYDLPQMRKRLFVIGIREDINYTNLIFPLSKVPLSHTAEYYLENNIPNKYYLGYKGFRYVTDHERNEGRARVNRNIIGCQTANQQFNWTGDFRVEIPQKRHFEDKRIYIGEYENRMSVARKLTPKECLNLMGFKDFNIVVTDQVMYRQVGNSIAVPVLIRIFDEILRRIEL